MDALIPLFGILGVFVALPWIILHYVSKWKTSATLTTEDENLLDELHDLARRLDDRMCTIERIVQAENPNWPQIACDPADLGLEERGARMVEDDRRARILEESRSNQPARRTK
jgi:phage shock protein B